MLLPGIWLATKQRYPLSHTHQLPFIYLLNTQQQSKYSMGNGHAKREQPNCTVIAAFRSLMSRRRRSLLTLVLVCLIACASCAAFSSTAALHFGLCTFQSVLWQSRLQ
jgi:hypothetical protein